MLVQITGAKCIGIDAVKVTVEVNCNRGIGIHLVGLADIAVKESLLRTTTALQSIGYSIPGKQIIINLAPADLHKNGSGYDLPIAVGIIAVSSKEPDSLPGLGKFIIMGELGLDGSVRPVPGALPYAELACSSGMEGIILPMESALEAVEFKDTRIFGVNNLDEVVSILKNPDGSDELLIWNSKDYRKLQRQQYKDCFPGPLLSENGEEGGVVSEYDVDFSDIIGQEGAKRAMEIAAAGAHNIALIGPPGSGKSSLAKALAGILPKMNAQESLLTSKIYSIAGKGSQRIGLIRTRPFRAPHYSASLPAIIGGGAGEALVPGEVSLAHNGVLYLDEFLQIPKSITEALRGPLEDRTVSISRLRNKIEYPASFMLVAASNPCPCGYFGENNRCTCTPSQRAAYLAKLSGPIMDRLDLQVWTHTVKMENISTRGKSESSAEIAKRVSRAREIQKKRFSAEKIFNNSEMSNRLIEKYCPLSASCQETLSALMEKFSLSMRAYFRIIKVARTIADLADRKDIIESDLLEAAGFRFLDRQNWIDSF